jgi:hypothetical protein
VSDVAIKVDLSIAHLADIISLPPSEADSGDILPVSLWTTAKFRDFARRLSLSCRIKNKLVGLGRFELPTNGLGNRCSIHLSYSPALPHYYNYITLRAPSDAAFVLTSRNIRRATRRRWLRRIGLQSGSDLADAQSLENRRPVFLQKVVRRAESDANPVTLKRISRCSLRIRKIRIRQSFCGQRPQGSRPVECFVSCVRASHQCPAERVCGSRLKSAVQFHEESRIFMQHRWQEKRPKKMAGGARSHRGPKSLSESRASLSVAGQCISCLADSGKG